MLVRMTLDGEPLYVGNDGVESIRGFVSDEGSRCWVQYLDGHERVVDGTPDEVFKALLNPPETVLKADVEKFIHALEVLLDGQHYNRPPPPSVLERVCFDARRAMGLERKR